MIGIDYLNRLYSLLQETGGNWADKKTSFDFLYEAAKDMAKETKALHGTQTITTVASQSDYDLNPDFMEVQTEDSDGKKVVLYSDGTNTRWISQRRYEEVLYSHNSTAVAYPQNFAIADDSINTRITGSATAVGAATGGESTLTDAAADFSTVQVGDTVYNTTQSYIGIVLEVTDGTHLKTSLFDAETHASPYAGWTNADAYIIQPQARYKLILDPKPSTAGHTVTVNYLAFPNPVYSDYGSYPFPMRYEEALLKYAVWLYMYRDKKPDYGNILFQAYDMAVRKANTVNDRATGRKGFSVSFIKR